MTRIHELSSLVAKVELERSPLSTGESLTTSILLEKRCKRMPTEPTRKWVSTLLGHWIVRIITCIKPCTELRGGENFICLIESGHLGFRSPFVGVGMFGSFATVKKK